MNKLFNYFNNKKNKDKITKDQPITALKNEVIEINKKEDIDNKTGPYYIKYINKIQFLEPTIPISSNIKEIQYDDGLIDNLLDDIFKIFNSSINSVESKQEKLVSEMNYFLEILKLMCSYIKEKREKKNKIEIHKSINKSNISIEYIEKEVEELEMLFKEMEDEYSKIEELILK